MVGIGCFNEGIVAVPPVFWEVSCNPRFVLINLSKKFLFLFYIRQQPRVHFLIQIKLAETGVGGRHGTTDTGCPTSMNTWY